MQCPTCHQEIPMGENGAPLLLCRECTAAKSYQSILEFQRQFLPAILKGDHQLKLTRPAGERLWHLVLVGYPQAWCGRSVKGAWKDRKQLAHGDIKVPVCALCREVFDGLAKGPA